MSLSSGEAEYYAMVRAAAVGLGIQAILSDWKVQSSLTLKTDASAAVGIAMRKGLGKVRHIEVNQLWLQEKVAQGKIKIVKVHGSANLADHLTKFLDGPKLAHDCKQLELERTRTRHPLTPVVLREATRSWIAAILIAILQPSTVWLRGDVNCEHGR